MWNFDSILHMGEHPGKKIATQKNCGVPGIVQKQLTVYGDQKTKILPLKSHINISGRSIPVKDHEKTKPNVHYKCERLKVVYFFKQNKYNCYFYSNPENGVKAPGSL